MIRRLPACGLRQASDEGRQQGRQVGRIGHDVGDARHQAQQPSIGHPNDLRRRCPAAGPWRRPPRSGRGCSRPAAGGWPRPCGPGAPGAAAGPGSRASRSLGPSSQKVVEDQGHQDEGHRSRNQPSRSPPAARRPRSSRHGIQALQALVQAGLPGRGGPGAREASSLRGRCFQRGREATRRSHLIHQRRAPGPVRRPTPRPRRRSSTTRPRPGPAQRAGQDTSTRGPSR